MEAELRSDPKEIAEHLMLIDLGRNDVGRIAEAGSVTVSDMMTIERYAHDAHRIARYRPIKVGSYRGRCTQADLPVGTLSVAPKVRALSYR